MKKTWAVVVVLLTLVGIGGHLALRTPGEPESGYRQQAPTHWPDCVTANGVVEGAQPEVALWPEITGTITAIYFRENQQVTRGSVLVELSNATHKEQVALAQAEVTIAQAERDRVHNGERLEKRRALAALENARRALFLEAKANWERSQQLIKNQAAVTREKLDRDHFRMLEAQAELEQAAAERALVEAPARADELAAAEGRLTAAQVRVRLAQAELAKTRLVAPCDGCILRVYAEPGELAGPMRNKPILLLADLSKRRVRAFIEELDAARVRLGQSAVVTVDGIPDRKFAGTVAVVMPRMGKRAVQTDVPEEYKDLYFREVLLDLALDLDLTPNVRAKVRIQVVLSP
jgi:HlyD family secretion protein